MADITQIHSNIWLVDVTLPEYSVRGAVIVGEQQAVVWDTLTHPDDMRVINDIIGDKPFHVVYSHADWDHIWGTAGLDTPQSIVGHRLCKQRFATDVPDTLKQMKKQQPRQWDAVKLVEPTLTFESQMNLYLGGLVLELHHLPGHTLDCIVGWIPETGILLGGDVMETPLPVINDDSPVEGWLSQLKDWSRVDGLVQTIPAHGTTHQRDCLDRTIAYLDKLLLGENLVITDELDSFYKQTHQKNMQLIQAQ